MGRRNQRHCLLFHNGGGWLSPLYRAPAAWCHHPTPCLFLVTFTQGNSQYSKASSAYGIQLNEMAYRASVTVVRASFVSLYIHSQFLKLEVTIQTNSNGETIVRWYTWKLISQPLVETLINIFRYKAIPFLFSLHMILFSTILKFWSKIGSSRSDS